MVTKVQKNKNEPFLFGEYAGGVSLPIDKNCRYYDGAILNGLDQMH